MSMQFTVTIKPLEESRYKKTDYIIRIGVFVITQTEQFIEFGS